MAKIPASRRLVPSHFSRALWLFAPWLIACFAGVFLFLMLSRGVHSAPQLQQNDKISEDLMAQIVISDSQTLFDVIVYLSDFGDLSGAYLITDKAERSTYVFELLRSNAEKAQADLRPVITKLEESGHLVIKRSFWIINALQVEADAFAIQRLVTEPEVEIIKPNNRYQFVFLDEKLVSKSIDDDLWNIQQIMAPQVWYGLGVDGEGVTVAIMDTGVDWTHPALNENYRGKLANNIVQHSGNWFDAVASQTFPFDPNGHGTHVAGTAIGGAGIGVAPGAKWIAVRILDENGFGTIADIHAGFEWLLAPNGDPGKSPDIVNNSWSGPPGLTDFMEDVNALKAAGIIPIFAAGNEGPEESTLGSPADYPGTIAVGATDDTDQLTWFSSRGPSHLTMELKPTFSAPGAAILSASPGGDYKFLNGTSMASPHVAGTYALLKSIFPQYDEEQLTRVITKTATLLTGEQPGNLLGWGRMNAYAAASSLTDYGMIQVTVESEGRIFMNEVVTITNGLGQSMVFRTDETGYVQAELLPEIYTIEVSPYGYAKYITGTAELELGQNLILNIHPLRMAYGTIAGRLYALESSDPISGNIQVLNTPIQVSTDADGYFSFEIPAGMVDVVAEKVGYMTQQKNVNVIAGSNTIIDFSLTSAPKILLIDSGQWYYASQIAYFHEALRENQFAFDSVTIRNPYYGMPSDEELAAYDIIIWSAPLDSPGLVGGGNALSQYLEDGGNLLISGQDVAYLDGQGPFGQYWWFGQLNGIYEDELSQAEVITGDINSIFADMQLEMNGPDSAQNQFHPDVTKPRANSFTTAAFHYSDGRSAGLLVGHCEPYRIVYFGFGLEGVNSPMVRQQLISRSVDMFTAPKVEIGAKFTPENVEKLAPPSSALQFEVAITNMSELYTDTYELSIEGAAWPVKVVSNTVTVGPCQNASIQIITDTPEALEKNTITQFELVARSTLDPNYSHHLPIKLKIPTDILLVDDDRWYDRSDVYKNSLAESGLDYDYWKIDNSFNEGSSPPVELLKAYPFVIWYTGYDWFRPLTMAESTSLREYLAAGGKLFLSSQDYLYYHLNDPLTRDFLGIDTYYESITPTIIYGNPAVGLAGVLAESLKLDFGPYQNFSDGILAEDGILPSIWSDAGVPSGVNSARNNWRTVFWGLPFETLPTTIQPQMMRQIIEWLSDFGDSTFDIDKRVGPADIGATISYSLTLINSNDQFSKTISITNPLPAQLALIESTLSGGAGYDPGTRQITWNNILPPGQQHLITYKAVLTEKVSPGSRIDNHTTIYDPKFNHSYQLVASSWVSAPDLSSSFIEFEKSLARPGETISLTAVIINSGYASSQITATLLSNPGITVISDTIKVGSGSKTEVGNAIQISDYLAPSTFVTVTARALVNSALNSHSLPLMLVLEDEMTSIQIKNGLLEVEPFRYFFPLAFK